MRICRHHSARPISSSVSSPPDARPSIDTLETPTILKNARGEREERRKDEKKKERKNRPEKDEDETNTAATHTLWGSARICENPDIWFWDVCGLLRITQLYMEIQEKDRKLGLFLSLSLSPPPFSFLFSFFSPCRGRNREMASFLDLANTLVQHFENQNASWNGQAISSEFVRWIRSLFLALPLYSREKKDIHGGGETQKAESFAPLFLLCRMNEMENCVRLIDAFERLQQTGWNCMLGFEDAVVAIQSGEDTIWVGNMEIDEVQHFAYELQTNKSLLWMHFYGRFPLLFSKKNNRLLI